MFKKILLPTDFSDLSWNAIVYAVKLFEKEPCTFYVLNSTMMKVSTMSNFTTRLSDTINESAKRDLALLKTQIMESEINEKHTYEVLISENDLEDAIDRAVLKYNIDLVVMSTKGASAIKGVLFGSNTVRVIKSVKGCPVLIIPEEFDFKTPEEIAFPTDFNRFYNNEEILPLKQLAKLHDSKIRILHINEEEHLSDIQDFNRIELGKYLKSCEIKFHWMPDYDKKTEEINLFIEAMYIDILVMIKYKHSVIEAIFNEPVIKNISFHPKVPLMIIPDNIVTASNPTDKISETASQN